MHRTRLALLAVFAAAAALLVSAAPASAAWQQLECTPTGWGGRVCLYRDTVNTKLAQGRYVNNSDVNYQTQGFFYGPGNVFETGCAYSTTQAHTTSVCTRELKKGRHYLQAATWQGGTFLGWTTTNWYSFGF
jgi:hypothetical protein